MKVRDVMTSTVVATSPDTPLAGVIDDLVVHGISAMPVVDGERRVIGVVSESDVVAQEGYGLRYRALGVLGALQRGHQSRWVTKARGLRASDVMSEPAVTARPDDDLCRAAARMVTASVKRLPVVDGEGRLVGIVTGCDVMRLFGQPDAEIAAALRNERASGAAVAAVAARPAPAPV